MSGLNRLIGAPLVEDRGAVPPSRNEDLSGMDLDTRIAVHVEKARLGEKATLDEALRSVAAQKAGSVQAVLKS